MKLWHCEGARSLRAVWALEELGLDYELVMLPFPPRVFQRDYLEINPLGTIPFFVDGDVEMTESCAIPHYLATRPGNEHLAVPPEHPAYGDMLNWTYHADATLTFPQTIVLRYTVLEPTPEKKPVADDYAKWFIARLRRLDAHLENNDYLVDGRFTIADICVGYALYFGKTLKLDERYKPQTAAYLERLTSRDAFIRADAAGRQTPDAD
ncbi:glutathione S-transferase family protein [Congregibacter sp.]|uniref:glutathione S-transferase family protein n=1 Tax=Congregibacter sp. TaxID=2744308 RepID=UPI003F6AFD4A